jgi:hypothetical protein
MWLVLTIALLLAVSYWPQTDGFSVKHNIEVNFDLPKFNAFSSTAKFVQQNTDASINALMSAMPFKERIRQLHRKMRS